jgi:hypothetical protein
VTKHLVFNRDLLLLKTGSCGWRQFGKPAEGERPPLAAVNNADTEDVTVDTSVCSSDLLNVVTRYIKVCNKSGYQS